MESLNFDFSKELQVINDKLNSVMKQLEPKMLEAFGKDLSDEEMKELIVAVKTGNEAGVAKFVDGGKISVDDIAQSIKILQDSGIASRTNEIQKQLNELRRQLNGY